MNYQIFHHIIRSNITLPELHEIETGTPTIYFTAHSTSESSQQSVEWVHHWRLPNGQIYISIGKTKKKYWIQFPDIASFQLDIKSNSISCYKLADIPDETIRHLLLDMVIPQLLSQKGNHIMHASCVRWGASAIAFCGESGWGKTTLSLYLHGKGHTLLTDDCLLLDHKGNSIKGTPSYQGARIFPSTQPWLLNGQQTVSVAHYGNKRRLIMNNTPNKAIAVSAIFVLNNPANPKTSISFEEITGATVAMELIKHSFILNPSDNAIIRKQLINATQIGKCEKLFLYRLNFPRTPDFLPETLAQISDLLSKQYPNA